MAGILKYVDVYPLQKVLDHVSCPASAHIRAEGKVSTSLCELHTGFGTSDWGLTVRVRKAA